MLTWWQGAVLGLVEGITEYLPISSTGHLILAASLLGLDHPATKDALDAYLVVVQGGAILAVLVLYRSRVAQMANGLLGRDAAGLRLAINLAVAFVPAVLAGLLLGKTVKAQLFSAWPVLAALVVGGVFMIGIDGRTDGRGDVESMTWRTALGIGLFQILALWPGTSRSMATIGGGMLLGLRTPAAAEFSFLLGLPTLGAACVHDLAGGGRSMVEQLGLGPTLIGVVVATVSAALAVRWLVAFLTRRGLAPFGWYRLLLAATLAALFLSGVVRIG